MEQPSLVPPSQFTQTLSQLFLFTKVIVVEGCSAPFVDIALLTGYASHANSVT
ncbi:hypothetical protein B0H10DRAFT_2223167 [Mycena sp. CBHHK59/15]|nr:hypothetical protein B0H10DRAFT_2223167 [Mycena sp. CBHHK59/15]